MKILNEISLIILFIAASATLTAQEGVNLVPNPSFEDTLYCPFFLGDLSPLIGWNSFGNTPDCFHSCSSMTINIPNSDFGYQYAHSGESMVGIISYVWELDPEWPNYREYIGTQLTSPLIIGEKYFVSFFINCAGYMPGWQHIGANKIGARFSTYQYNESEPTIPDNFSHIYTDSIVTDTVNWYKVSGAFIADSAYQFLIIGNFYDHIQTDTIIFGGPPFGGSTAYYYIDDVCVTTDSLYNEMWQGVVSVEEISNKTGIVCYPNPTNSFLNIKSDESIVSIELFNSLGQSVHFMENINSQLLTIPIIGYSAGYYVLKINLYNQIQSIKLLIN